MSDITSLFTFISDQFNHQLNTMAYGKLLLAILLGGIIGLEREAKRKPVGVRTCIIISVTTCILTIVSISAAEYYAALSANIRTDPMRLAAQVVSGIGFLGTGVILHKTNDMISGITTAAMIWVSAAMGIAIGAGFYGDAIIVSLIILLVLRYSHYVKILLPKRQKFNHVMIKLEIPPEMDVNIISESLNKRVQQIKSIGIKEKNENTLTIAVQAQIPEQETSYSIYKELKGIEQIQAIEIKYFL